MALVAGLAALAVAALLDATLSGGREEVEAQAPAITTASAIYADTLAVAGIRGRLLYTDAGDCTLHGLALPSLEPLEAPDWDTCAFTPAPGGAVASEGTVFDPRGRVGAAEFEGSVEIVGTDGRALRLENMRAPAYRPDGTLTAVQGGALVSLRPCPGRGHVLARIGRCRSTILTERRLTALAPLSVDPSPLALAIVSVAWVGGHRLAVLASAGEGDVLLGVDTREPTPRVEVWFEDDRLTDLVLSPRRRFVSVVTATGELGIFDEAGALLGLRGSRVRAAAWSPDETWLALLDGDGVVFVDGRNGSTVGPVPLAARDLAWR